MTAAQFLADLEAKPGALRALADRLGAGNPFAAVHAETLVGELIAASPRGPPLSPGSLLRGTGLAAPPAARIPV
jgi:hypothetical protein